MYAILILLLILIPLIGALHYFGIAVTRVCFGWFTVSFSLPTRWEGKFQGTSGFFRRNFMVFRKYSALTVKIDTYSGTLDFEAKAPDGSMLSPASGVYGRDASILIDVSHLKRCSVALRMDHFSGQFRIALQ